MTQNGSFAGKLAVVTGGGSGIGRELVRQLAAQGCSVAACDLNAGTVAVTAATAWAAAPPGVQVTSHACDVSDEAQVQRFRDELLEQHASDHVDLVFANAGISGGGSFVKDSRQEWERTFAINWWGVYYCARTFLPLLIASGDGVLVNTSSVAGFWPTAGSGAPITAYCTSEFAIKGFSEALTEDLRSNAPQVRVVVVMPGVVNTDIYVNSRRALGQPEWEQLSDAQLLELLPDDTRAALIAMGLLAEDFSADDLRQVIAQKKPELQDQGFTAVQAATIILDGVRPAGLPIGRDRGGDGQPRQDPDTAAGSMPPLTGRTGPGAADLHSYLSALAVPAIPGSRSLAGVSASPRPFPDPGKERVQCNKPRGCPGFRRALSVAAPAQDLPSGRRFGQTRLWVRAMSCSPSGRPVQRWCRCNRHYLSPAQTPSQRGWVIAW